MRGNSPRAREESAGEAAYRDVNRPKLGTSIALDGPVKSLVDDLTPLFGQRMISGRTLAKDYRVRKLRISRGHAAGRAGVRITLWYL